MKSLVAISVVVALWLSLVSSGQGATYTNTIQSYTFSPPTRTIAVGDTVVCSGAQATSLPVAITIDPPLRILKLSVGPNLVLTSAPTNYLNVHPEYTTNFNGTNWFALTVQSNRLVDGALEIFCGRPAGSSVFIRLK